jgi:hypothetical protein
MSAKTRRATKPTRETTDLAPFNESRRDQRIAARSRMGRIMARKRRHTPEQVIGKLGEAEVKPARGTAIAHVCKDLGDLLPLAPRVRRHEGRPGEADQGAGAGERPPEAAPGRRRAGQGHPERGRLGCGGFEPRLDRIRTRVYTKKLRPLGDNTHSSGKRMTPPVLNKSLRLS